MTFSASFGPFFGPQVREGRTQPQIERGIGSGVVISPDGYIVTNNHVIDGAVDIRVTMSDRKILAGEVDRRGSPHRPGGDQDRRREFPSVPWGDSDCSCSPDKPYSPSATRSASVSPSLVAS